MTDIEQIKREASEYVFKINTPSHSRSDFAIYLHQYIDYLHSRGYLDWVPEWQPIETALKDCCIDTFGTIQTHHGKKIRVRVTDDYMSSNSPYPLTTTYFEHPNGLTGTYTREAWMPLPAAPKGETK